MFRKHNQKGPVKHAKIQFTGRVSSTSENKCASECAKSAGCESFDYCVGNHLVENRERYVDSETYVCYVHVQANQTADDNNKFSDTLEQGKEQTNCNHYTRKHFKSTSKLFIDH